MIIYTHALQTVRFSRNRDVASRAEALLRMDGAYGRLRYARNRKEVPYRTHRIALDIPCHWNIARPAAPGMVRQSKGRRAFSGAVKLHRKSPERLLDL